MPLYEYECESCGARTERIQKSYSDPPLAVCPKCGGPVRKLLSSPAIQFKGSGWYITDYARKSEGSTADKSSTSDAKSGGETGAPAKSDTAAKSDTGAADAKPATAAKDTSKS